MSELEDGGLTWHEMKVMFIGSSVHLSGRHICNRNKRKMTLMMMS